MPQELLRLDLLLLKAGLFPSRSKAQAAISAGLVLVDGKPCERAGRLFPQNARLELTGEPDSLVGRGGEKLRHALELFSLDVKNKSCLDVGASTGGFTQVLLLAGARLVYAVDVGHGQLADCLREDPRVVNMEGCNFRELEPALLAERPEFACVDVSFISLRLILPKLAQCLPQGANAVCLVKPQFEAGRGAVGKGGIVRDAKTHARVLREVKTAAEECGFSVLGECPSPILGGSGNKEFLLALKR